MGGGKARTGSTTTKETFKKRADEIASSLFHTVFLALMLARVSSSQEITRNWHWPRNYFQTTAYRVTHASSMSLKLGSLLLLVIVWYESYRGIAHPC